MTGETGIPTLLVFPVFPVFPVFLLGRLAPSQSVDQKRRERWGFCAKQESGVRSLLDAKNASKRAHFRRTRKSPPQFAWRK